MVLGLAVLCVVALTLHGPTSRGFACAHVRRHIGARASEDPELQRILAELDEDEEDYEELSATELRLAADLELALKADMVDRADEEQVYLGEGEALPLCRPSTGPTAAEMLCSRGVVRVGAALSIQTATDLRKFVVAELGRELAADTSTAFTRVLAPGGNGDLQRGTSAADATRWDLRLPLDEPRVLRALYELYGDANGGGGGAHSHALAANAGGEGCALWELAALISSPGAAAQVVHSDTTFSPTPILFTSFVSLQPIDRSLGPTRFIPLTHHDAHAHAMLAAGADLRAALLDGLDEARTAVPLSYVGLLETGDASIYDGRVFHCGGANTYGASPGGSSVCTGNEGYSSEEDAADGLRILFYATFRHADRLDEEAALDEPERRSILAHLAGRHTLGTLRQELTRKLAADTQIHP